MVGCLCAVGPGTRFLEECALLLQRIEAFDSPPCANSLQICCQLLAQEMANALAAKEGALLIFGCWCVVSGY